MPDSRTQSTSAGAVAVADGPEPGQTPGFDPVRLHLLSAHRKRIALSLTDEQATGDHEHEHRNPGPTGDHYPTVLYFDDDRMFELMVGVEEAGDEQTLRLWNSHQVRAREAAAADEQNLRVYEGVTRYTLSVLPEDDPWRRHYEIHVTRRSGGEWIVEHGGYWANAAGEWVPISSDTADGRTMTRSDALELAHRLAPTIEVNNRTATDVFDLPMEGRR